MPASTTARHAYRGVTTRQGDQMSTQPDHAPIPPYAPAPGAPAELLAQLRADRRADTWVPAFEQEWATALGEGAPYLLPHSGPPRTFHLSPRPGKKQRPGTSLSLP
ncbi:hypothetical protein [Streptomyces sp. NPDC018352]|uniref:hypothetical protein n=1 Tax=Streptomyces sp. NPDC018352 TaxID=3157194 RepID=UPI0033C42FE5